MTFTQLTIPGVWLVEADTFTDERGSFVRAWIREEFATRGLETGIEQCTMASNHRRGTLRGMHSQAPPFDETKLVRVIRGTIWDVALDLRPDSPTYCRSVGVELGDANKRTLYIPKGVAHGYQTLTDNAEVLYFLSAPFAPSHQRGVRWNDPAFAIVWPLGDPTMINERDATFPDYVPSKAVNKAFTT